MSKLAINGGKPIRKHKFPAHQVIGPEERSAVDRVFESGVFSRFLGTWHEDFHGGPEVQRLEKQWAERFRVRHAISVNSATSGIFAAVGAIGIEPGDEVIVSPYTMSASAVAPLVYGGIPIFADIEEEFFCLSADSVRKKITPRTKAIIVVDIFGLPYDRDGINQVAREHGLRVIEDCAQAPGAMYRDQAAGTLGDIGIFSLNYHKHIHTGEGGIIVTNDDELADRVRLIRNHAESVVGGKDYQAITNMVGFNYRMTEIEAAMAQEQLRKLDLLLPPRLDNVAYLNESFRKIACLKPAKVRDGCKHAYYLHALKYDSSKAGGVHRNRFVDAVKAELAPTERRETEGIKIGAGYVRPLYLLPIFQRKIAFGNKGYPWAGSGHPGNINYDQGICPVVERIHFDELLTHELMQPQMTRKDLDDVVNAFTKVWENLDELRT